MEERFLLARLQHKDEKALAQLIDQYAGYVLATVRAAGAGVLAEADLEEAAADTFVKLWGAAASVRPEKGGLKAYLGAIARNEARSRVRRARPVLRWKRTSCCRPTSRHSRRWKSRNRPRWCARRWRCWSPPQKRFFCAITTKGRKRRKLPGKCR